MHNRQISFYRSHNSMLRALLILAIDRTVFAFFLRTKHIYKIYFETPNIISSLRMIPVTCFPSDDSELYEVHTVESICRLYRIVRVHAIKRVTV